MIANTFHRVRVARARLRTYAREFVRAFAAALSRDGLDRHYARHCAELMRDAAAELRTKRRLRKKDREERAVELETYGRKLMQRRTARGSTRAWLDAKRKSRARHVAAYLVEISDYLRDEVAHEEVL